MIFVAIPKTGTTSVIHALNTALPQNQKLTLLKERVNRRFRARHGLNEIGDKRPGRAKHLSAIQIKYVLGDAEFDRCFKFTLVRNPWARMVSRYRFTHVDFEPTWRQKLKRRTTRKFHNLEFEAWLNRCWKRHKKGKRLGGQLRKLTDLNGRVLVDFVGRLEQAQDALDYVSEQVGLGRIVMPHINGTRPIHYATYYNQTTRDMVWEMCQADIEYFNYRFEEPSAGANPDPVSEAR
ncbi:sulfotransferase family 2 domain-containing protein [Elongatibacter sediminis]|uniref:Sulfotransferase family 2 domain-containing protein n=1 Tax=Elongatibacter sediminis TaxID=3119006 RepID=A0AAW9RH98_9GAMM